MEKKTDGGCFWTIGHSTKPIEEFIALLKEQGIQILADVRQFPGSRRHPQFGKENLAASLAAAEIEYAHLPELGGRRPAKPNSPNTAWRNDAFRGYADYMATRDFLSGMEKLTRMAAKRRVAYMCAEVLWWQCHRGLISDFLKVRGNRVLHIVGPGKVEEHPYTSAARVVKGELSYAAAEGQPELGLEESKKKL